MSSKLASILGIISAVSSFGASISSGFKDPAKDEMRKTTYASHGLTNSFENRRQLQVTVLQEELLGLKTLLVEKNKTIKALSNEVKAERERAEDLEMKLDEAVTALELIEQQLLEEAPTE